MFVRKSTANEPFEKDVNYFMTKIFSSCKNMNIWSPRLNEETVFDLVRDQMTFLSKGAFFHDVMKQEKGVIASVLCQHD